MSDVDALIQACCAVPTDATRRGALADMLAEMGEGELEAAMRSADGEKHIRAVHGTADVLKRAPCLRLLWGIAVAKLHYAFPPDAKDWRDSEQARRARRRWVASLPPVSSPVGDGAIWYGKSDPVEPDDEVDGNDG